MYLFIGFNVVNHSLYCLRKKAEERAEMQKEREIALLKFKEDREKKKVVKPILVSGTHEATNTDATNANATKN